MQLKIYAAMDPGDGPRHLGDLLDLEPTQPEAQAAMDWLLNRRTSKEFRHKLKEVLERIGHEQLAERF